MNGILTMSALTKWANGVNDNQAVQFSEQEQKLGGEKPAGGLGGRSIVASSSQGRNDTVQQLAIANRACSGRTAKNAANEFARQTFLSFIYDQCGLKGKNRDLKNLPENVRNAMKLNGGFIERHDWDVGKSRPLTARRIKAVLSALDENDVKVKMFGGGVIPATISWKEAGAQEFWDGLDKGLRLKLINTPKKTEERHVLQLFREAYADGLHNKSMNEWLRDVNDAYKRNKNGNITIDTKTGTVTFE